MKSKGGDLKMHQCSVCPKTFPSASKLRRHALVHTGQKPFICSTCGKAFSQSEHLKTHTEKIHSLGPSTDSLKDGSFANDQRSALSNHNAQENYRHDISAYIPPSSTLFPSVPTKIEQKKETLALDISLPSSENKQQPEPFPHFNDGFMITSSISANGVSLMGCIPQYHVSSAAVDNATRYAHNGYTCKVCLKSFSSPLQLQIHAPIHNKQKPFESWTSRKAFSKKGHLTMHSQSYQLSSGRAKIAASHQCPSCPKTFCSPSKLKRHFLIHTGQKPFHCVVCGRTFRQEPHLTAHLRGAHKMSGLKGLKPNQAHVRGEKRRLSFPSDDLTSNLGFQSSVLQHPSCQDNFINSAGELELQCKISVGAPCNLGNSEIKSETAERYGSDTSLHRSSRPISSEISKGSVEHEQRRLASEDLKPFKCKICNRSFRLVVNLMRHQAYHKNQQKGFQNKSVVDDVRNVVSESPRTETRVNPEPIKTSPEPSIVDSLDLNIIVKSETWSENLSDDDGCRLQRTEFVTSADQERVTGQATREHQRIRKESQQCHTCFKGFPSLSKLQRHMMSHSGQRPFGCLTCGKSFRQKTHLRIHSRTHLWSKYHKQRSWYISRPPSRIAGIARLLTDVPPRDMFSGNQKFEKNSGVDLLSERQLGQANSLLSVWNDSNTEPQFLPYPVKNYEVLPSSAVSNVTLEERQTVNAIRNACHRKHKCLLCFKCFPSASKLKTHEMVHTGLKPFQCLKCGKTFRQSPHLKAHEKTHTKSNPYKPSVLQGKICIMKIRSQQQPQYPRINVHLPSQNKSIEIGTGHSKYPHQKQFEHPAKSVTSLPNKVNNLIKSKITNQQFEQPTFTKREKPVPNKVNNLIKSKITNQRFEHPTRSEKPVPNKLNGLIKFRVMNKSSCSKKNPHMCRICLKSFATPSKLSRHLLIHSGIRPYKCSLCSKTFTQRTHLKVHERSRKHDNRPSDHIQEEMVSRKHLQDKCLDNGPAPETLITAYLVYPEGEQPQPCYTNADHYLVTNEAFSHTSEATGTEGLAIGGMDISSEATDTKSLAIGGMDISSDATDTKGLAIGGMDISSDATDTKGLAIGGMDISEATDTKGLAIGGMGISSEAIDTESQAIAGMNIPLEATDTEGLAIAGMDIPSEATDTEGLAAAGMDIPSEATDTEGLAIVGMGIPSETSDREEIAIPEVVIPSEATDTEVLVIPELSLLEENIESESKQNDGYNQTHDFLGHFSFPSDLATEIQRLVQSQDLAVSSPPQQEMGSSIHSSLEIPFQTSGVPANSDHHKVLSDRLMSSMVDNPLSSDITDYYWCEPLNMFECDKCTWSFETENDLQCHKCNTGSQSNSMVQSVQKYKCDICFKNFVSPSKLQRHFIIHTGLRPFRCDTCGKAFTQSTHLKTHQRIHK